MLNSPKLNKEFTTEDIFPLPYKESPKTFSKSIDKLVDLPMDAILKNISTVASSESVGNVILNPSIKLRNKFNDIQLKISDREEIYSYLSTMDCIESKQYKIHKFYYGKEINSCMITNKDSIDWDSQYLIQLEFHSQYIIFAAKEDVDVELFKEILDWLHGLTFKFRFIICNGDIKHVKKALNILLKILQNRLNLMFYCDSITYEFKSNAFEEKNDHDQL